MSDSSRRVRASVVLILVGLFAFSIFIVFQVLGHERSQPSTTAQTGAPALPDWMPEPVRSGHRRGPPVVGEGAERPPGPSAEIDPADPNDQDDVVYDPQTWAMRRTLGVQGDGGVPLPFQPTTRPARIVAHRGELPSSADAACEVRVLPVQSGGFNCLVRVMCAGAILYPNPSQTAGYVPCELQDGRPVSAQDDGVSAQDGDPRLSLDLRGGRVTVEDEGNGVQPFSATLRIGG